MLLSKLIKDLQSGLDEFGEMEVTGFTYPHNTHDITDVFRSGDNEVCLVLAKDRFESL